MKKKYEEPVIEVTRLKLESVIMTSPPIEEGDTDDSGGGGLYRPNSRRFVFIQ